MVFYYCFYQSCSSCLFEAVVTALRLTHLGLSKTNGLLWKLRFEVACCWLWTVGCLSNFYSSLSNRTSCSQIDCYSPKKSVCCVSHVLFLLCVESNVIFVMCFGFYCCCARYKAFRVPTFENPLKSMSWCFCLFSCPRVTPKVLPPIGLKCYLWVGVR